MEQNIFRPKAKNSSASVRAKSNARKVLTDASSSGKVKISMTDGTGQTATDRVFFTAKPNEWETVGTLSKSSGLSVEMVEDVVHADNSKFETALLAGKTVVRAKK